MTNVTGYQYEIYFWNDRSRLSRRGLYHTEPECPEFQSITRDMSRCGHERAKALIEPLRTQGGLELMHCQTCKDILYEKFLGEESHI